MVSPEATDFLADLQTSFKISVNDGVDAISYEVNASKFAFVNSVRLLKGDEAIECKVNHLSASGKFETFFLYSDLADVKVEVDLAEGASLDQDSQTLTSVDFTTAGKPLVLKIKDENTLHIKNLEISAAPADVVTLDETWSDITASYKLENNLSTLSPSIRIYRNLTLIGGTDIRGPIAYNLSFNAGELRPCTIIFAKERSVEGVNEALFARRTAVYGDGKIYGSEEVLKPLFEASLKMTKMKFHKTACELHFENTSNVPIIIKKAPGSENVQYTRFQIVYPHEKLVMWVNGSKYQGAPLKENEFNLSFYVENYLVAPGQPLLYRIKLTREQ